MSAPARSRLATRVAMIRARSGISPVAILLLPVLVMVYAYFAQSAELIGQSPTAVVLLSVLVALCWAGMRLRPVADRLELFRVFSFYYLMVFCIGPLFEPAVSEYVLEESHASLLERTAALAVFAYLCIALGYHLPLFGRAPTHVRTHHEDYDVPLATGIGLALFAIGVVSFALLFVSAGGAAVILHGEGAVQRTEFSFGLGWYYWGALLMLPGGVLYFAAQASQARRLAWLHAWPLVTAFLLLLLLQGRHRAIGPILMMFFASHYVIRRIRLLRFAAYAVVGIALAIVMSSARAPGFRGTFSKDPIGFSIAILEDFPDRAAALLSGDIGRVDEVMIVVDHVPDRMPYDWGTSLTIWLNPIRRILWGPGAEAPAIGNRLYDIARPDMRESLYRTGFLPSIVGEMRANFPWWVCFFPYLLYGLALRWIYDRLVIRGADFTSFAVYAILVFHMCNMVIGTFAQAFFEIAVVVTPALLARRLCRRRTPRPALAQRFSEL